MSVPGKCQLDIMRDNIDSPQPRGMGAICPRCGREDCPWDRNIGHDHHYDRETGAGWLEENYYCPDCAWKLGRKRASFRLRKEVVDPKPGGGFKLVPVAYVRVD